jgi:hypothetical protein
VKGSLDIFSTEKESRGIGPFPEWTATIYKKIARRQSDVRLQKLRNSFRSDNKLTRFENTTSCSNLRINLISYPWKKFEKRPCRFPDWRWPGVNIIKHFLSLMKSRNKLARSSLENFASHFRRSMLEQAPGLIEKYYTQMYFINRFVIS